MQRNLVIACACLVCCVLAANAPAAKPARSAASADWPRFRGADGLGASADTNVPLKWGPDENILWKTELPGPGASSPVLVGGRIFLTCYTGYNVPGEDGGDVADLKRHLVCLDRATGKQLWAKTVDAAQPESEKIREDHGYATSTPAADAERVYVFFGKSGVFAFDHKGKQLWQRDVGSNVGGWGSATSPVLVGDLVIVNASVESESMVALDRKTGKEVWRAEGVKESWNAPLLVRVGDKDSRQELVVAVQGKILGFDPKTGTQLWSCDTDIGWYMVPSLVAEDGVVYCVGGKTGQGLAVRAGGKGDVTRSHRLWTIQKGSNVPSPVFTGGHLYWVNENTGNAYCVEGKTGKIVYEQRLGRRTGQVYASPILAGGRIYYTARDGKTVVLAAKPKYEVLAENEPPEERGTFNASPAVADGRLFVRSNRYLYCIGEK